MSQLEATALYNLFQQLKLTTLEDAENFDQAAYAGLETDAARLQWLQDLDAALKSAVDDKEREIADLESEVDDLRAVESPLGIVTARVKLRLGIVTVEGQLPLPEPASGVAAAGPEAGD